MLANIFCIGHDLGIHNLLHVLEICLAVRLSNAESQRVFSFYFSFYKSLLHIRSDIKLHEERYRDAADMFLNEYPDGTVRNSEDVPLNSISDDEWSSDGE